MSNNINVLLVDLFCGAGGVTTGVETAMVDGNKIAKVIACVNHDPLAIESHESNHPDVLHFSEDIKTVSMEALSSHVNKMKALYPDARLILWASLECTNYSKAKGGMPRDADSRTLANHLFRYFSIDFDIIFIENVEEFMSWGPLDNNGKPMKRHNGNDYIKWIETMKSYGFQYDYKLLNSADFGAYTSRKRYFGQFVKIGLPFSWPEPTHAKLPKSGMFGCFKKWKAVKEVLDFTDEGESIFNRNIPLVEKTLERIYCGLIKYVAGGKDYFISKYYSGFPQHKNISVDGPAGTIKTIDGQALVKACFIQKYNSNDPNTCERTVASVENPCPTVTTQVRMQLIQASFLQKYHGHGENVISVDEPCSTISTKDRLAKVSYWIDKSFSNKYNHQSIDSPAGTILTNDHNNLVKAEYFIDRNFSQGSKNSSIETPAGSLTTVPKLNLIKAEKFLMSTNFNNIGSSIDEPSQVVTANHKYHYIVNPQWFNTNTHNIEDPCPVIIARQDKTPLYLCSTEPGQIAIPVFEDDSEFTIKIKEFMVLYGIIDIKMRMLRIPELKRIMGFPINYILKGNQAHQKKFIGNAVEVNTARKLMEATAKSIINIKLKQIA